MNLSKFFESKNGYKRLKIKVCEKFLPMKAITAVISTSAWLSDYTGEHYE